MTLWHFLPSVPLPQISALGIFTTHLTILCPHSAIQEIDKFLFAFFFTYALNQIHIWKYGLFFGKKLNGIKSIV
jgi:hypothetical protein